MKRLLTAQQMKILDKQTIMHHKIPEMVLMERAALAVVKHLDAFDLARILVVCGSGNNGGDGIAVARLLHLSGKKVDLCFIGSEENMSEGCRNQMDIAITYGISIVKSPAFSEYTTIVDAILGVGLCRKVSGKYADIIEKINNTGIKVMAVDIPSGISADDGSVLGCAVKAYKTVTFAYGKVGHMVYPGKGYCGKLKVEDIGIYQDTQVEHPEFYMMEKNDLNLIPLRKENGNKGTFGKVLLIAGSEEMPGASILSALAVLRTGAGMLRIIAPSSNRYILATSVPEAILDIYDNEIEAVANINNGLLWADVVVMGPGIGNAEIANKMVTHTLNCCRLPLVLDADGLNIVSKNKQLLLDKKCSCIITPHIGEMARLINSSVEDVIKNKITIAKSFSEKYQLQCVLKDAASCIAIPDGTTYINTAGNSGMATAGSGDVLTGIIGGLLAIGVKLDYAGALGSYIHGYCGDRIQNVTGASYLVASDLINELACLRLGEENNHEKL